MLRPFTCRITPTTDSEHANSMSGYVVDMTLQVSEMASQASLPAPATFWRRRPTPDFARVGTDDRADTV